ncbi:Hexosyltransferase [Caenorhabditis elegans]|uniref:Hexosyltransferase n=1 Tax=Caenorhabditis elegans TaxID=6239 RepID=O62375_CAEEL|nr:Hexosyltransferase [Caenorhabditis elegans]CAB05807.1 Hexosyltransferase [Caenorhabditis elegans]|eukprot:NP_506737.1 Hexosyltransferase [Caenorhabditis elegans]
MKSTQFLIFITLVVIFLTCTRLLSKGLSEQDERCSQAEWKTSTLLNSSRDFGSHYEISFADIQGSFEWLYLPKFELNNPEILLIATSRPDDFSRRNAIRKTWMNQKTNQITSFFMVGLSSKTDEKVRDIVMREAELYRDIVVTSLEDSYTKLAFKTLSILLYAVSKVPSAQLIGRVDGDVLFFPNLFQSFLDKDNYFINTNNSSIYGYIAEEGKPTTSKCCKSRNFLFPFKCSNYLSFLSGPFFLLTRPAAEKLLNASKHRDFHQIDDQLITGQMADDAGVKRINLPMIHMFPEPTNDFVFAWHNTLNDFQYVKAYKDRIAHLPL